MDLDSTQEAIVAIIVAIISVAIIALLVSSNAKTVQVIGAATTGFGQILQVAVSPVTGGSPFASSAPVATPSSSGAFTQGGGGVITQVPGIIANLTGAISNLPGIFGN